MRAVLDRLVSIDLPLAREILVVDDGSTDSTADALAAAVRDGLAVTVIRAERNGGKGSACGWGSRGRVARSSRFRTPTKRHAPTPSPIAGTGVGPIGCAACSP